MTANARVSATGTSHPGQLREDNEDTFICNPELGLYAVFDGMGGHNAGDVAAQTAAAIVARDVHDAGIDEEPGAVLSRALAAASEEIYVQAQMRHDRHGMGTTAVAVLVRGSRAAVSHVGDSRVYLWRANRMKAVTSDHTVVAEMLKSGAITPEEAVHHPYKSVLSRCLGHRRQVKVDTNYVDLLPGDRLILCSDGLNGYASDRAIEQVLGGAEDPERASADLVELALRGGGGDNVTTVVLFAGQAEIPESTQLLRSTSAHSFWQRRTEYLDEVRTLGIRNSPLCSALSENEAVTMVAGNACDAIFHDLEQGSSVHMWTYADNLASGWVGQGGSYEALRDLLDLLRFATVPVVADVARDSAAISVALEIAIGREFIVAEMAVAGAYGDRLRLLERRLADDHAHSFRPRDFTDQPTVPFLGGPRSELPSEEVVECLNESLALARQALQRRTSPLATASCLEAANDLARGASGGMEVLALSRELYDEHDQGTMPLFEALEHARMAHLHAAKVGSGATIYKADAVRRLASAYQSLANGLAVLVVDAGRPITDELKELAELSARLREQVKRSERRLIDLRIDRAAASTVLENDAKRPRKST